MALRKVFQIKYALQNKIRVFRKKQFLKRRRDV